MSLFLISFQVVFHSDNDLSGHLAAIIRHRWA